MKRLPTTLGLLATTAVVAVAVSVSSPVATTLAAVKQPATPTTTSTRPSATTTPPQTTTTTTTPPRVDPGVLAQQVVSAVQSTAPGSKVGLLVVDTGTGTTLASANASEQFYTASVVKLLIALDLLSSQNWAPDADTQARVHQMLAYSDDSIADALWDADGGNSIVSREAASIGLTGTQPPEDETQWGETLMTAQDVVAVYHYITTTVPEPSRDLLLTALSGAAQTAADGTDQYFGIPDALPGTSWAIKQGWMQLYTESVLNTTGLVGPNLRYALVLLGSLPAGTSTATGDAALTAGVAALRSTVTS
ncbi:hypothetical protein [Kutzneria albida]|uniref:Secreted protein n=1 Tax=Kutzneria albida DSM 43870 TaxID=1449976 RepID=W5WHR4_9PSEU|nr:hypothetical protein [Kutzneria albida]AHI00296.1 hypothetical protein KALB_6937 [Kutzneria albida DSM 43870]